MKFLIVKPSSLGDVACAMPVVTLLKRRYPGCTVDWLVNEEYAGLARAAGADRIWPIWRRGWKRLGGWPRAFWSYLKVVCRLPFTHYDYVLDLQGLLRSGLFTFLSSHGKSVGFADAREGSAMFYGLKVPVRRAITHASLCNLEILKQLDVPAPAPEDWPRFAPENPEAALERFGLDKGRFVLLVPSSRWFSKNWLPAYLGELGERIHSELGLKCVLVGGASDLPLCWEIADRRSEAFCIAAGKTGWSDLLALASTAACAVTPDTGPMHVMAAAGTPIVALMGPTDPRRHGPYGVRCRVLQSGRKCLPCYHRDCVLAEEGRPALCMTDLTPETVLAAVKELLAENEKISNKEKIDG